jgi:capsule biosynthesis phosphatase
MIILIPLGGTGERFKKNGYKEPKALIKVFGKSIINYLLDSLNITDEMVYIPYNKEYEKYRLESTLRKSYPNINFKFLCLNENTRGAAETINIALKELELVDSPIICLDGDNFYKTDIIKKWDGKNIVFTVEDKNKSAIYSYIKSDGNKVIDIIEKEKVSDYACTGAYGFESYKKLLKYTNEIIEKKIMSKGEFYISNVIKQMIKSDIVFEYSVLDKKNWCCLGTPIQVRSFCNNNPLYSCNDNSIKLKPNRICFDLDNTLVTYPKKSGDYTTVEPIEKNINFLKYLKKLGNTIIIYTARRMKTHSGNNGKLLADIGLITFNTLKKYEIPFDEIYFGKPYANVYVDDLAMNCFDDMEKGIGYYMDKIEPRDFNKLVNNSIETYKKISEDLSGEIYYYKNIPSEMKDLFPLFIDYDRENKWYLLEKINGLTVSTLYLSELLTTETLKHIMNSINRIHNISMEGIKKEINIYSNYSDKLERRYKKYDYSQFKGSYKLYDELMKKLKDYEEEDKGDKVIIHGDPVFTNIIINEYEKIKLIDMRGIQGEELTLLGDRLYDWGKLYQSLIGYDKILMGKEIDKNYEEQMISYFEKYFIELFDREKLNDLKMITRSLLFTLIPLHNNDKCIEYYNLINKLYLIDV